MIAAVCAATSYAAPAGASADSTVLSAVAAADSDVAARLQPDQRLLEPVTAIARPLPAAPTTALITAVTALSATLGLPQQPAEAIVGAGLSPEVAGRTANLLTDVLACHRITAAHYAAVPTAALPELVRAGTGVDASVRTSLRSCADGMWSATVELQLALQIALPARTPDTCAALGPVNLDLWPVLRFDGRCADSSYPNDYLVIVDVGGNDTYRNNAGSNMVDLNFSPAGAAVTGLRGTGPARGCQRAIPGLTAADCTPSAAVLLDLQGQDTYGVKQTPDHDAGCTNDPVIRRMMTGGAGFLGVGILRDSGGTRDVYTGKTGALGAGHIFGVGLLSDTGGNDSYAAVRNSQGFALVGGLGVLRDSAGADTYAYAVPAAINPAAANQTEGAGGVRDDEGEGLCDRIPRFTAGAANVLPGTVGILVDDAGADTYRAAFAGDFTAPLQNPSTRAGSLGFGNNQAVGVFLDRGTGTDAYTVVDDPTPAGAPRRGNNVTIAPANTSTGDGGGLGLFVDN